MFPFCPELENSGPGSDRLFPQPRSSSEVALTIVNARSASGGRSPVTEHLELDNQIRFSPVKYQRTTDSIVSFADKESDR